MHATITVRPWPDVSRYAKQLVVGCAHASARALTPNLLREDSELRDWLTRKWRQKAACGCMLLDQDDIHTRLAAARQRLEKRGIAL